MTKQEFLTTLQRALGGKVSVEAVQENVRFYDDYISMEMRKGRTEQEVLEELGDARLLARTIVTAQENSAGAKRQERESGAAEEQKQDARRHDGLQIPGWLVLVIVAAVAFFVIFAMFSMLSWLLPVLIPLGLLWLAVRFLRSR